MHLAIMGPLGRICSAGSFTVRLHVIVFMVVLMCGSVEGKMVDLTHPLNNRSAHWPGYRSFEITSVYKGNYASLGGAW